MFIVFININLIYIYICLKNIYYFNKFIITYSNYKNKLKHVF